MYKYIVNGKSGSNTNVIDAYVLARYVVVDRSGGACVYLGRVKHATQPPCIAQIWFIGIALERHLVGLVQGGVITYASLAMSLVCRGCVAGRCKRACTLRRGGCGRPRAAPPSPTTPHHPHAILTNR